LAPGSASLLPWTFNSPDWIFNTQSLRPLHTA
jgi:hypothetical protein